MSGADDLLSIARERIDVQSFQDLNWTGTFRDYMRKVYEEPMVIRNAYQRVYDMIMAHGFD